MRKNRCHKLNKKELVVHIKKKWDSGDIASALLSGTFEGYDIPLKPLKESDYSTNIKRTIKYLGDIRTEFDIKDIIIDYKEINFRSMGRQRFPIKIRITTSEALLALIGKASLYKIIEDKANATKLCFPDIFHQLCLNASVLIENIDKWNELLKVVRYFYNGLHREKYLRELDIEGVDSKFIEKNNKLVKWALDIVLDDADINADITSGKHAFERRFNLKYEKPRIRLRILDPVLQHDTLGCEDLEILASDLDKLSHLMIDTVYITENKVSGLTFPRCRNSIVIFGLGYSVDVLKPVSWLNDVNIVYWGDIDTHGFLILSRLRSYFPKTKSFLMDIDTYQAHKNLCVQEPIISQLPSTHNLTDLEVILFDLLSENGLNQRLEQERLPFGVVIDALKVSILS